MSGYCEWCGNTICLCKEIEREKRKSPVIHFSDVEVSIGGKVIKPLIAKIRPEVEVIARIAEEGLFIFRMKMVDAHFLPRKRKKAAKKRIYKEVQMFLQKKIHSYLMSLTPSIETEL